MGSRALVTIARNELLNLEARFSVHELLKSHVAAASFKPEVYTRATLICKTQAPQQRKFVKLSGQHFFAVRDSLSTAQAASLKFSLCLASCYPALLSLNQFQYFDALQYGSILGVNNFSAYQLHIGTQNAFSRFKILFFENYA